jgi:XisH protein
MARDKFHYEVRTALEKEGWTITHDPYKVMIGRRKGYIDLGAEIIGAEKVFWVFLTLTNLKMR